jgi:hypothetical protein
MEPLEDLFTEARRLYLKAKRQRSPFDRLAGLHNDVLPALDALREAFAAERDQAFVETFDQLNADNSGEGAYERIQARLGISKALVHQRLRAGRGRPVVPWRKRDSAQSA